MTTSEIIAWSLVGLLYVTGSMCAHTALVERYNCTTGSLVYWFLWPLWVTLDLVSAFFQIVGALFEVAGETFSKLNFKIEKYLCAEDK